MLKVNQQFFLKKIKNAVGPVRYIQGGDEYSEYCDKDYTKIIAKVRHHPSGDDYFIEPSSEFDKFMLEYDPRDTEEWKGKLFYRILIESGFDENQAMVACKAVDFVCPHCFDNESGCKCWNDE